MVGIAYNHGERAFPLVSAVVHRVHAVLVPGQGRARAARWSTPRSPSSGSPTSGVLGGFAGLLLVFPDGVGMIIGPRAVRGRLRRRRLLRRLAHGPPAAHARRLAEQDARGPRRRHGRVGRDGHHHRHRRPAPVERRSATACCSASWWRCSPRSATSSSRCSSATSGSRTSARILPGHGGVLDRFDAMLFCLPAVYYLVVALRHHLMRPHSRGVDAPHRVLGSTGSIGTQALDVVRSHRDEYEVVALAAARNGELLAGPGRGVRRPPRLGAPRVPIPLTCSPSWRRSPRSTSSSTRWSASPGCRRRSPRSSTASASRSPTRRASSPAVRWSRPCATAARARSSPSTASTPRSTSACGPATPSEVQQARAHRQRRPVPRLLPRAARRGHRAPTRSSTPPGTWAPRSPSTRRRS